MTDEIGSGQSSVLLIGGTDAGKSNFLFRLWIAIDHGRGALVKAGLPREIEYLRAGAEQLLEGRFADHTSKDVQERVVVPVKSSAGTNGATGTLVLPDVNGEQILAVYRNRRWSQEWEDLISSQCACLMFVRAGSDDLVAPLDWVACFEKYGAVMDQSGAVEDEEGNPEVPTQVVLTEWLQFLRRAFTQRVGPRFRPRVGVIVSAWDAVPTDQKSAGPLKYLEDNLPMLFQFMRGNHDAFDFQAFGVSIVDGDLKADNEFKETYLKGRPADFGFVVHSLAGTLVPSSDLTLPVAWALGFLPDGAGGMG